MSQQGNNQSNNNQKGKQNQKPEIVVTDPKLLIKKHEMKLGDTAVKKSLEAQKAVSDYDLFISGGNTKKKKERKPGTIGGDPIYMWVLLAGVFLLLLPIALGMQNTIHVSEDTIQLIFVAGAFCFPIAAVSALITHKFSRMVSAIMASPFVGGAFKAASMVN